MYYMYTYSFEYLIFFLFVFTVNNVALSYEFGPEYFLNVSELVSCSLGDVTYHYNAIPHCSLVDLAS